MVKRYDIDTEAGDGGDCEVLPLIESSDGDYVEYDDYAALLASHQELLAALKEYDGLWERVHGKVALGRPTVVQGRKAIERAEKLGGE